MKRIDIIASEATFETLGTFETIHQLNETVREYKCKYMEILTTTELTVLDILHRYSAKYTGVSFLRKGKIAELIGKSRRTIIRVCKRLEALGIIKQLPMKRPTDMQQTSNAIVIQPVTSDHCAEVVTQDIRENVTPVRQVPLKTKPLTKERTKSRKPSWIPTGFYSLLDAHIDSEEIVEYWRSVYAITYRMGMAIEDRAAIGIEAFMAMKAQRRQLRKPIAYFTGAVKRMATQRYVTALFNDAFDC